MHSLKSLMLAAAAAGALIANTALAQEPAHAAAAPAAPRTLEFAWAPKKAPYDNYVAPNKPWWKLSDVLAAHSRTASWQQPVVRNKDLAADWHQLAAGEKTRLVEWPDNRVGMMVWQGQVRISIKGQEPFVAAKGFEVNIPLRLPYTMETVGSEPALWLEVHQAGDVPIYPVEGTPQKPKDIPGYTYTRVIIASGDGVYDGNNKPYLDYYKVVVNGAAPAPALSSPAITSS